MGRRLKEKEEVDLSWVPRHSQLPKDQKINLAAGGGWGYPSEQEAEKALLGKETVFEDLKGRERGAWVAPLVESLPLPPVSGLRVWGSNPTSGSLFSKEPASPSRSAPPPCSCFPSLSYK